MEIIEIINFLRTLYFYFNLEIAQLFIGFLQAIGSLAIVAIAYFTYKHNEETADKIDEINKRTLKSQDEFYDHQKTINIQNLELKKIGTIPLINKKVKDQTTEIKGTTYYHKVLELRNLTNSPIIIWSVNFYDPINKKELKHKDINNLFAGYIDFRFFSKHYFLHNIKDVIDILHFKVIDFDINGIEVKEVNKNIKNFEIHFEYSSIIPKDKMLNEFIKTKEFKKNYFDIKDDKINLNLFDIYWKY